MKMTTDKVLNSSTAEELHAVQLAFAKRIVPAIAEKAVAEFIKQQSLGLVVASINSNGELILGLSNGNVLNCGVVKGIDGISVIGKRGPRGQRGPRGTSINTLDLVDNKVIISLTDGSLQELPLPVVTKTETIIEKHIIEETPARVVWEEIPEEKISAIVKAVVTKELEDQFVEDEDIKNIAIAAVEEYHEKINLKQQLEDFLRRSNDDFEHKFKQLLESNTAYANEITAYHKEAEKKTVALIDAAIKALPPITVETNTVDAEKLTQLEQSLILFREDVSQSFTAHSIMLDRLKVDLTEANTIIANFNHIKLDVEILIENWKDGLNKIITDQRAQVSVFINQIIEEARNHIAAVVKNHMDEKLNFRLSIDDGFLFFHDGNTKANLGKVEGQEGPGVHDLVIDPISGELSATFISNGKVEFKRLGRVVGEQGPQGISGNDGKPGISVDKFSLYPNGDLWVWFDNGDCTEIGNIQGPQGDKGEIGVGISSTRLNADGELIINFSDGKTANVGKIVGSNGKKGDKGEPGKSIKGDKGDAGSPGLPAPGFKFKGKWQPRMYYGQDDNPDGPYAEVVVHDGKCFICNEMTNQAPPHNGWIETVMPPLFLESSN